MEDLEPTVNVVVVVVVVGVDVLGVGEHFSCFVFCCRNKKAIVNPINTKSYSKQ